MGSADIYQAVERLPEVAEALVIGAEQPNGGYWMPLFVVLAEGSELSDELRKRITDTIRTELSPRHVPDDILAAPGVPHTRTGKKLEVPIKRLLQGADPAGVVERSAVDNPALLDWYAQIRRLTTVAGALGEAGFEVDATAVIQTEIWYKLWGNMTMNPISALTGATTDLILGDKLVAAFCTEIMREASIIGAEIGCPIMDNPDDRNDVTRRHGAFKTSMLQDVEAGKPLEIDAMLSAVREIALAAGIPFPFTDAV